MRIKTKYDIGDTVRCEFPGEGERLVVVDSVTTTTHSIHGSEVTRVNYGVCYDHVRGYKRFDIVPEDRIKVREAGL